MYLAMNRFQIVVGKEDEFELVWKNRETYLEGVKGFKKFNLIKGIRDKEFSLYVSHSEWNLEEDFWNWTKSESFKLTHKNAASHKDLYIGAPHFEGFEVII
jgi:heme-degrading monooxygenase HmoA